MSKNTDGTSEKPVEQVAQEAADKAVAQMLLRLGIDADDSKVWRNDFFFLARMSRGAHQISSVVVKTCAGAAALGLIWILMQGIKDWFSTIPIIK